MNNMETEVEGIQTRCFSRCFAAINEMKIVIVTIYNFQEQQKTNFPPLRLLTGWGGERKDRYSKSLHDFPRQMDSQFFSAFFHCFTGQCLNLSSKNYGTTQLR